MENIVEKGEIAQNEQFQLFPQCFPKACLSIVLKWVYMEERVKNLACLVQGKQWRWFRSDKNGTKLSKRVENTVGKG